MIRILSEGKLQILILDGEMAALWFRRKMNPISFWLRQWFCNALCYLILVSRRYMVLEKSSWLHRLEILKIDCLESKASNFCFFSTEIAFQSLQRALFYLESNFKNHLMNCQFVIFVSWFSPHTMVCQPTNNRGYLKMLNNCTFKKINKQATHKKVTTNLFFMRTPTTILWCKGFEVPPFFLHQWAPLASSFASISVPG